jgi:hypothetical protein
MPDAQLSYGRYHPASIEVILELRFVDESNELGVVGFYSRLRRFLPAASWGMTTYLCFTRCIYCLDCSFLSVSLQGMLEVWIHSLYYDRPEPLGLIRISFRDCY